mmetsp:Transcript_21135/g.21254  ORF Transcript_21135/g.21254 Transcript_21135/m.21254 type:complete len:344 (+) Transcript_21135:193-1224(+)|eukprot:CAMPEP_0182419168 /NCGR_PEP_ID=MMETSP1167-20130531/3562_1 /TAXON_ID=2988 /ORGANISM="Mallomonas Sp, Strain CCMP3275" /LENGTH=343 /DNA_ID=CAMNT_0024593833 /DNA_START=192 /DNA_END=1223 /DNA_ORIENTATION=-
MDCCYPVKSTLINIESNACQQRSGKWSEEEEEYAEELIKAFKSGRIYPTREEARSLRSFLSRKLNCNPMRISKKFPTVDRLGGRYYPNELVNNEQIVETQNELRALESRFHAKLKLIDLINQNRKQKKSKPSNLKTTKEAADADSYHFLNDLDERLIGDPDPDDEEDEDQRQSHYYPQLQSCSTYSTHHSNSYASMSKTTSEADYKSLSSSLSLSSNSRTESWSSDDFMLVLQDLADMTETEERKIEGEQRQNIKKEIEDQKESEDEKSNDELDENYEMIHVDMKEESDNNDDSSTKREREKERKRDISTMHSRENENDIEMIRIKREKRNDVQDHILGICEA